MLRQSCSRGLKVADFTADPTSYLVPRLDRQLNHDIEADNLDSARTRLANIMAQVDALLLRLNFRVRREMG